MKKILFLLFTICYLLLTLISPIQAQTNKTYCQWNTNIQKCEQVVNCKANCVPPVLNCPNRSKPDLCIGVPQECNCQEAGTLKCVWKETLTGGTCNRVGNCGPGYEPSPKADLCQGYKNTSRETCENASAGACLQSILPQPIPPPYGGVKIETCSIMGTTGIKTALGCIPTGDTIQFVSWFLRAALGFGGGIAFLLMIFGAIKLLTSGGNPEGIKAGGETITSALMGLLFMIFSLFLLHLIGVDILKIPGF